MLSVNSLYLQGSSHTVCQDYTRAHVNSDETLAYGILSDGCSSSPDTDVGARLLVLETEKWLLKRRQLDARVFQDIIHDTQQRAVQLLPLYPLCTDATLLTLYKSVSSKFVQFHITGDGLILARRKGTQIYDIQRKNFPNGMPWYLSYELNPARLSKLMESDLLMTYEWSTLDLINRTHEIEHFQTYNITQRQESIETPIVHSAETHDLFLLMSDGIESFVHGETKISIPYNEVLYTLLDFKNFHGEFVVRRFRKALKEFQKNQWVHQDDLSVAALYSGE